MNIRPTSGQYCNRKRIPSRNGLKHICENAMNEFIARFIFQEKIILKIHTKIALKKPQKVVSFITTSNKKMSAIAEDENKSFREIF